jgi:IclR family transcriptional regulator, pca regulon regulatory protein
MSIARNGRGGAQIEDRSDRDSPGGSSSGDKEYSATLAKGLAVLAAFSRERPSMSLSEAAACVGLSRATARRLLRTLTSLGYVLQDGRRFCLAPRILELGFAYLSTQSWIERAEPLMKALSNALQESCSVAMLEGAEIVYLARAVATHRIMSTTISIGTRLPAFHTSLGRVQLGFLPEAALADMLKAMPLAPYTANTIVDRAALVARIKADRAEGFSIVDEELEKGLRSIAVPIVTRAGACIAAINLSAHSNRTTRNEMREKFLPRLRDVAGSISRTLA